VAINKTHNDYAAELGPLFEDMPKAVIAAIAVSMASGGGSDMDAARAQIADEWRILHLNGIVPQKPSKSAMALMPVHDAA